MRHCRTLRGSPPTKDRNRRWAISSCYNIRSSERTLRKSFQEKPTASMWLIQLYSKTHFSLNVFSRKPRLCLGLISLQYFLDSSVILPHFRFRYSVTYFHYPAISTSERPRRTENGVYGCHCKPRKRDARSRHRFQTLSVSQFGGALMEVYNVLKCICRFPQPAWSLCGILFSRILSATNFFYLFIDNVVQGRTEV